MSTISVDSIINHTGKTFSSMATARRRAVSNSSESSPASFKEIFGDFADSFFKGDLDLSGLDLNSLEGCPFNIEESLHIQDNPNLKSLSYVTTVFDPEACLNIDIDLFLASLESHLYIYDMVDEIDIYMNTSDQEKIEKALIQFSVIENDPSYSLAKDISLKSFFIRKENSSSPAYGLIKVYAQSSTIIKIYFDSDGTERLFNIYKGVGFDRKKFDRVLELL